MGSMATLDPPLDVMRSQVLACTTLERAEIGWIGDPDHASRESAHNPENPPPPGNPPDEVDAIDVPHAPDRGADMHVMTEELRQAHAAGRDNRLRLVIFNGRQWSNYDHAEGPRFTWRKYYGENPHTKHAHIERTDSNRTDLRPFEIGIDMDEATRNHIIALAYRVHAILSDLPETLEFTLTWGGVAKKHKEKNVLHDRIAELRAAVDALKDSGAPITDEQVAALGAQLSEAVTPGVVGGIGALQFVPTPTAQ